MSYREPKPMTEKDWADMMQKSDREADAWLIKNSTHLEKLDEWLKTKVKIGHTGSNDYYDGNIRALIHVLGMNGHYICEFIKRRIAQVAQVALDVPHMIQDTVLPSETVKKMDTYEASKKLGMVIASIVPGDEVTKQNLLTLCTKINELDDDHLQALHDMLCPVNVYDFSMKAWGRLVDKEKKGGRKLTRRRNPKTKSKQKHKRSGHKRSGHKRSGHKSRRR